MVRGFRRGQKVAVHVHGEPEPQGERFPLFCGGRNPLNQGFRDPLNQGDRDPLNQRRGLCGGGGVAAHVHGEPEPQGERQRHRVETLSPPGTLSMS